MKVFRLRKRDFITILFILLCILGYIYFPANGFFQYKAVVIIFFMILPFLYNKYFLKRENLFKKTLIKDWKNNLKWLVIGMAVSLLIMFVIFKVTDIQIHYLLASEVKKDFIQFLLYEFTGVAFTVAMYDFFFRNFTMFYFAESFGKWAILIQVLFFAIMLLMLNLPYWFYITYLVFAPFAGWIAYKSNSIIYSFIGQLFFTIIIDAGVIALTTKK